MKPIISSCVVALIVLGPVVSLAQQRTAITERARQEAIERARAASARSQRQYGRRTPTPTPVGQRPSTRVTRNAQPRTIRRASTRRGVSARRPAPSAYRLERFQLKADLDAAVLYFQPMDVVAKVGEEFTTALRLSNPKNRGFTRMFLALEYNPEVLLPLEVNDLALQAHMQTPARAYVYESRGLLTYEAQFTHELALHGQNLLTVKWRALAPARYSAIRFSSFDARDTTLARGAEDILGEPGILGDGTIGATVRVVHPSPEDESEILTGTTIAEFMGPVTIGGVKLALRSRTKKVRVGEEFLVDIDFENAKHTMVDNIHVIVRFDPRVLEVVDYDEENWIARGINIYDGPYHEKFPFDRHIKNIASNARGEIEYHMGISESQLLADSGTLATIVFRAIRPAANTAISFFTPPRLHAPGTRITCMGTNVLGDLTDERDGVENLAVTVVN